MADNARMRGLWSDAAARTIRAERAAAGMTQAQVHRAAGMARSTYLRLESGERVADIEQLAAIAAALGMSLATMMDRIEQRATADPMPEGAFTRGDLDLAADRD